MSLEEVVSSLGVYCSMLVFSLVSMEVLTVSLVSNVLLSVFSFEVLSKVSFSITVSW